MKRTKFEELFMLSVVFSLCMIVFASVGCGGTKSCETPDFGCGNGMCVAKVPGAGGCLSSGEGCMSTSLWSQSCTVFAGQGSNNSGCVVGASNNYYVNKGCGGCADWRMTSCDIGYTKRAGADINNGEISSCKHWAIGLSNPTLFSCGVGDSGCNPNIRHEMMETNMFIDIMNR